MGVRVNIYLKDYNKLHLFLFPKKYINARVEESVQKYKRLHLFPIFKVHMFPSLNVNAKVTDYQAKNNRLQIYYQKVPSLSDIRAMFVH
jgi:hypothetical protein